METPNTLEGILTERIMLRVDRIPEISITMRNAVYAAVLEVLTEDAARQAEVVRIVEESMRLTDQNDLVKSIVCRGAPANVINPGNYRVTFGASTKR